MSAAELFPGAGASPGVEVWRIERLEPVKQPRDFSGKFHVGDSYVVLHAFEASRDRSPDDDGAIGGSSASPSSPSSSSSSRPPRAARLAMNVHHWIGAASSQDDAGAAATLMTVELDRVLGDENPTQLFLETQGAESGEFLQLWRHSGVAYLDGGVDGTPLAELDARSCETRLLRVEGGGRCARAWQVPARASSLNSGDVFILDAGRRLYQARSITTLVPIRPRRRGERRSSRTLLPGVSLRPSSLAFNPRHTSTPFNSTPDAFQLHPAVRSYGPSTLSGTGKSRAAASAPRP
jgi:hypothetical protein